MSARRQSPRRPDGAPEPGSLAEAPAGAPAPPPALLRDRWALASALAVLLLVIHAWGAPLGEAVAEDFDFLHRVMFSAHHTLLDGGGSTAFWRPLSHQIYYETLGGLIITHPGVVAALHVLLLALSSLLLYRAFRRTWSGPAAAIIATFPLLSESTRTLISWPSHFVDLGVWLFTAVAIHETAALRLWSTLLALLAALLCKEVALVAAALLPWMPGLGPSGRNQRLRWAAAMAAVSGVWAAAYVAVRHHAHLALPHHLETSAETIGKPVLARLWWAVRNSVRALLSLPATRVERAAPILIAGAILLVIAAVAAVLLARRARGRARARGDAGRAHARGTAMSAAGSGWTAFPLRSGLWGLAWFLAASITLVPIFPIWAPNRSGYGSLGCAIAILALAGAARPWLPAAFVGLRLLAFALSPGPVKMISDAAPQQGAFMDFERLVRLQRVMRGIRVLLTSNFPTLPPGAEIGQHYLPRLSEYALGGSKAIQVWYRDSTLRWVRYADFVSDPSIPLVGIAEFQSMHKPQFALVDPDAMRTFLSAHVLMRTKQFEQSIRMMAQADSLQRDRNAVVFLGELAGETSVALAYLSRNAEAESTATHGVALWAVNPYAHFTLGWLSYQRGNLTRAASLLDSVVRLTPDYQAARSLLVQVRKEIQERNRLGLGTGP